LGYRIAAALGQSLAEHAMETFPDGEVYVCINADLLGSDVFVVQTTGPPVAENLVELMLLGDACSRAGAARLTAVVPYFGYARQDRRMKTGESVGARVVADMIAGRYDRILAVDLHNPAIEGFFSIPVDHLTALPLLVEELQPAIPDKSVVVAPDLGAVKLARRYADRLDLPVAYVHKVRISGDKVEAVQLTGSVLNRSPLVVDDMISTGGTLAAAIKTVLAKGCTPKIYAAATHGLFTGRALKKLTPFPIEKIFVSDSLSCHVQRDCPLEIVSLADAIAEWIEALTDDRTVRGGYRR
jgi:ribose-phosphate pyrophosphokinase